MKRYKPFFKFEELRKNPELNPHIGAWDYVDKYKNDPARKFSYKENVFFQEDVGDALKIYNDYYQQLKVGE